MISVGVLTQPYRIVYIAKNFASGLAGITLKVIRPDLQIVGNYDMTEFSDPELSGCYYYDFITTVSDPSGDYIVVINNPEQAHKEGIRIRYSSIDTMETIASGLAKNYFGG